MIVYLCIIAITLMGIPVHTHPSLLMGGEQSSEELLLRAAQRGDAEQVQKLLDQRVSANSKYNECIPLGEAAGNGHMAVVQLLLDRGADIHRVDKHRWTPLMHAAYRAHVDMVTLLLKYGANVQARVSPLMVAARRKDNLRGQWFENCNIKSITYLFGIERSECHGMSEEETVLHALIDHGADVNAVGALRKTALMEASLCNNGRGTYCKQKACFLVSRGAEIPQEIPPGIGYGREIQKNLKRWHQELVAIQAYRHSQIGDFLETRGAMPKDLSLLVARFLWQLQSTIDAYKQQ